jgi:hypothetical protein
MNSGDAVAGDIETDPVWLERLRSLNEVIASTGEPLRGNLFYGRDGSRRDGVHHQHDFVTSPPNEEARVKRERLREAVSGRKRMLEIGVNGGHSAYLALTANPTLELHGVDICDADYVKLAVEWLEEEFPDRVFLYPGNSLKVVPRLAKTGLRFDAFHVDGAKFNYYRDILNCQPLIAGSEAIVVLDDTNRHDVYGTWNRCIRQSIISLAPAFPSMPQTQRKRNEIGLLHPSEPSKRQFRLLLGRVLYEKTRVRPTMRRARSKLRGYRSVGLRRFREARAPKGH